MMRWMSGHGGWGRGEFHLPACPVEKPWENQPAWPASPSAAVSMRKYGWPGGPGFDPGRGLASQEMPGAYLSTRSSAPPSLPCHQHH